MNFNFDGHLIESRLRTREVERRATLMASLGSLPRHSWLAWLHRRPLSNEPVTIPQRQGDASSCRPAKAA